MGIRRRKQRSVCERIVIWGLGASAPRLAASCFGRLFFLCLVFQAARQALRVFFDDKFLLFSKKRTPLRFAVGCSDQQKRGVLVPTGNTIVAEKKRGRKPKESSDKKIHEKKRNWLFVIYPGDSAPDNWLDILRGLHLEGCVSPLHDQDVNEVDEEQKKAHRHVMLCFDGPTTWETVRSISVDMLHGTCPIPCNSMRGSVRYFLHMDNPEKAQYSMADMLPLGGFDVESALDVSGAMLREAVRDMQLFIVEHDITEFFEFADWCLQNNTEWHTVLTEKRTMYFDRYIRSRRHGRHDSQLKDQIEQAVRQDREVVERYRSYQKDFDQRVADIVQAMLRR